MHLSAELAQAELSERSAQAAPNGGRAAEGEGNAGAEEAVVAGYVGINPWLFTQNNYKISARLQQNLIYLSNHGERPSPSLRGRAALAVAS